VEKSQDAVEVMSWDFSTFDPVPLVKKKARIRGPLRATWLPSSLRHLPQIQATQATWTRKPHAAANALVLAEMCNLVERNPCRSSFLVSRLTTLNFRISRMTLATAAQPSEGPQTMAPSGY
jgi:hypothetical protein